MTLGFSFSLAYSQRLISDIYVVLCLSFLLRHKHILYINTALPLSVPPPFISLYAVTRALIHELKSLLMALTMIDKGR